MTDRTTKICNACDKAKPVDQFRLQPPRQPGRPFSRHSWCTPCEREAARIRADQRYNTDPEWRQKQIANSAVQYLRKVARERERQRG
jgi:hypothetical protein